MEYKYNRGHGEMEKNEKKRKGDELVCQKMYTSCNTLCSL